jgi:hypothetical protein
MVSVMDPYGRILGFLDRTRSEMGGIIIHLYLYQSDKFLEAIMEPIFI